MRMRRSRSRSRRRRRRRKRRRRRRRRRRKGRIPWMRMPPPATKVRLAFDMERLDRMTTGVPMVTEPMESKRKT